MKSSRAAWLTGLIAAALLMVLASHWPGMQYLSSDDAPIVKAFLGFETGRPADFHFYLHAGLVWLLQGISLLFPKIAWFSVFQLLLLWFSLTVIIKSMIQCAVRSGLQGWIGAVCGLLFCIPYAMTTYSSITYTATAALAGTAAVCQWLSISHQTVGSRKVLSSAFLCLFLLMLCYLLRPAAALPALLFCGLSAALTWFTDYAGNHALSRKPLWIIALTFIGACFVLVAVQRIAFYGHEELILWQEARTQLMDYLLFGTGIDEAVLSSIGWSEAEYRLVQDWFFLNGNISADAFTQLSAARLSVMDTSFAGQFKTALSTLRLSAWLNPEWKRLLAFLPFLFIGCCVAQWRSKEKRPWLSLFSAVGLFMGAAAIFYLSLQGRLPLRAALSVFLPLTGYLFCITLLCQKRPRVSAKKQSAVALAVFAAASLWLSVPTSYSAVNLHENRYAPEVYQNLDDLEGYAMENPNTLIIYDPTLLNDPRLFPDVSQGVPTNVLFWGGWAVRTPGWHEQLARFGLSIDDMTAADLLRDNILFATANEMLFPALIDYAQEGSDQPVACELVTQRGGVRFFRFTTSPGAP